MVSRWSSSPVECRRLMMGESVRDVASGVDNVSYRYPLGVVAAISHRSTSRAMIPLWTLPVAIGAGNTYILKPSERTPLTCTAAWRAFGVEAGIPEGVLQHRQRSKRSRQLHPGASGYRGRLIRRESQPVAEHVYTHGTAHGKRVQALAGAKNSMIVMPDAVLDRAVPNIIASAYGNAGERCLAGSVLVAVGEVADTLVEKG